MPSTARALAEMARNAAGAAGVSWLSVLLVGRVYDFHRALLQWLEQTRSERWLLEHCEDDHFSRSMAQHSDVCAQVLANSRVWPVAHAAAASLAQLKMCGFCDCAAAAHMVRTGGAPVVLCFALLYVLTPSFLLPVVRGLHARRAHAALLRRCSPLLRGDPWGKPAAGYANL